MDHREIFINYLTSLKDLGRDSVTRKEILDFCENSGILFPQWFTNNSENRKSRGVYYINMGSNECENKSGDSLRIKTVKNSYNEESLIPQINDCYVSFGIYSKVLKIVKSNKFFPTYIVGHSGVGKTLSVEQACAVSNRQCIVFSTTADTDESDFLGNYVLIDGNMVWRDGPITTAARLGAILCIDEVDYGSKSLSSLQRVLEGKPFLLKKKGELITPKEGFNIFVTANTKGKGSDGGRYMFTNILNEAFLDRFVITLEQFWPTPAVETKIIENEMAKKGIEIEDLPRKLVQWANTIRKIFDDGGLDEVISPRRLVHIVTALTIFPKIEEAIQFALNRFDKEVLETFIDFYSKIDAGVDLESMKDNEGIIN